MPDLRPMPPVQSRCLWWLFERWGWNDRRTQVAKRFWCISCSIARRRASTIRQTMTRFPSQTNGRGALRSSAGGRSRLYDFAGMGSAVKAFIACPDATTADLPVITIEPSKAATVLPRPSWRCLPLSA